MSPTLFKLTEMSLRPEPPPRSRCRCLSNARTSSNSARASSRRQCSLRTSALKSSHLITPARSRSPYKSSAIFEWRSAPTTSPLACSALAMSRYSSGRSPSETRSAKGTSCCVRSSARPGSPWSRKPCAALMRTLRRCGLSVLFDLTSRLASCSAKSGSSEDDLSRALCVGLRGVFSGRGF